MAMRTRAAKIDDQHWQRFTETAAELDVTPSALMRSLVEAYVQEPRPCVSCGESFTVIGSTDLPVAGTDVEWDGAAAADRVFQMCTDGDTVDPDCVSRAFLYRDPDADPTTKAAYKLGFADVVNGELQIIPRGVYATAGGRGVDAADIPAEDAAAIKTKICTLYGKIDDAPECPFAGDEAQATTRSFGVVVDENGDPVLDDEGEPQDCSCDENDDDYHPDCDCSSEKEPPANAAGGAGRTAAIVGYGALSDSQDPETQAAVTRVRELLAEGAVGVSVAMDMDPESMPDPEELDRLVAEERYDEIEALLADVPQRLRHLAVLDTPAFSDARLTLNADGSVQGPMTYEGIWTGDMRFTPYGSVQWESTLPIPIIWDRQDGDHTGTTVGSITRAERVDDQTTAVRATDHAVAAAARVPSLDSVPAAYFAERKITADTPFTIAAPDANGLRAVYGLAAPKGVCHRSGDGSQCFQYPGDVDPKRFRGFHTGTALTLDNGTTVRVGALTLGGMHIDTTLAAKGVGLGDLDRYRQDANQVFALVRAYETPAGLAVAGVVVPGVTEKQLGQARACAPSVELWPSGRGRTLAGIHLVPSPAWPVAAAAGSVMEMVSSAPVQVHGIPTAATYQVTGTNNGGVSNSRLDAIEASLSRLEKAMAMLAANAITDVPVPEE
jgi:hypothetical protein